MQPLISPTELADRLDEPGLRVCDVRWYLTQPEFGRREYETDHLPGAVFVDLHEDLSGRTGPGRHPLPAAADFAATLGRLGIDAATTVVAYDDTRGGVAARLWWMLRSIGHHTVNVLDGGYLAWVDAGLAVTADVPTITPTEYPLPHGWTGVVDADEVAAAIGGRGIVDARAPERYRGETEPIDPRAGHIPTALNLFHLDNVGADGRHLPVDALRVRFEGLGDRPIVYCGSGVSACHDLLAMAIAGIEDGVLYEGSWSDWSSDPARPAVAGSDDPS